ARSAKDRATLEQRLGPLMADSDKKVVEKVALCLIEPETRMAAALDYSFEYFQFDKIHAWPSFASRTADQRPLVPLQGKPAFLEQARGRVSESAPEEAVVPALLLAQYGDFTGLDHLLPAVIGDSHKQEELGSCLLAGIALSRDTKYLPALKKMAATAKEDQEFRRLLQTLKGMSGPEARELRLEINKRLRQGNE
ncbi:MAG: hypothetical protein NT154_20865, partial [Verrucomicrobia bacterium]|nr:hypothetical protein [Verrucomicrobiota bacterium]